MQVVLTKPVEHLGQAGDVKTVKSGYARNYLLPEGLAIPATLNSLETSKARQKKIERQEAKRQEALQAIAGLLKDQTILIKANANEEGHLFGSVDRAAIVQALEEQKQMKVAENAVDLPEPLKALGTATIHLVVGVDRVPFFVTVTRP